MKPHIIVSSHDLERLEALVDSLPSAQADSKEALLDELARAEVVAPDEVPPSVVTMHSKVRFVIETSREEFCLTLGYPKETSEGTGHISVLSPVGSALLGMSAGDQIDWPLPGGRKVKVTVLDVVCQPERAAQPDSEAL